MQSGRDYSWSKPFNPNPAPDEEYGSHVGPYAALNIRNREPGYHYAYAHRDDPGSYRSMQMMGFRPVQVGESDAVSNDFGLGAPQGSSPDTLASVGKLVQMKIPLDRYAKLLSDAEAAQRASREGPTQEFLEKGRELERSYNRRPANVGAAFAYPEHGRTGYRNGEDEEW